MHLRYGAATDTGRRRNENQDSYLVDFEPGAYPSRPALFVVCDGVGGARAGKTASAIAVQQIQAAFHGGDGSDLAHRLVQAAEEASTAIFEHSLRDPATEGMATTLVAAAFDSDRCHIVNVGDSRAYRIRNGLIERVTTDHTIIQEQIESGLITAAQAEQSPYRHVITRSLGGHATEVGAQSYPAAPLIAGDAYLLCSDGLTDMVGEEDILTLGAGNDPQHAAEALVALANEQGGRDNITVVIVCVDGESA